MLCQTPSNTLVWLRDLTQEGIEPNPGPRSLVLVRALGLTVKSALLVAHHPPEPQLAVSRLLQCRNVTVVVAAHTRRLSSTQGDADGKSSVYFSHRDADARQRKKQRCLRPRQSCCGSRLRIPPPHRKVQATCLLPPPTSCACLSQLCPFPICFFDRFSRDREGSNQTKVPRASHFLHNAGEKTHRGT